ncbi:3-phosphoshikimate 1-carboxyvinyltransferase [soil metagenome]
MRAVAIIPSGPLTGEVVAPASKSVTNRLLLLAALAEGTSVLRTPLVSDDSAAMRDVIEGLGAVVEEVGEPGRPGHAWRITGTAGHLTVPGSPLQCRLSGTTMRFAAAVAALAGDRVTLTGDAPLLQRPIGALTDALRALGADASDHDGLPPVTVGGGLAGGDVTVDARASSQFASAVLLAAPYARSDVRLTAHGAHAAAYIDLTVQAMDAWGGRVVADGPSTWVVTSGTGYRARELVVEYDASAAAHLFGLATATGGRVGVVNATDTIQPDAGILEVLARFGAAVDRDGDGISVTGPERLHAPGTIDLSAMPDQVTTIAALAALVDGVTTIVGTEVVRGHETDRLAALATELSKLGTQVQERPDGLVIDGRTTTGGAALDTHHDHRLAMSFAAIGARVPGVVVNDPGCVAKTYPDFWTVMAGLGAELDR